MLLCGSALSIGGWERCLFQKVQATDVGKERDEKIFYHMCHNKTASALRVLIFMLIVDAGVRSVISGILPSLLINLSVLRTR